MTVWGHRDSFWKKSIDVSGILKQLFDPYQKWGADRFIQIFSDFNQLRQLTGEWKFRFKRTEDARFYFCPRHRRHLTKETQTCNEMAVTSCAVCPLFPRIPLLCLMCKGWSSISRASSCLVSIFGQTRNGRVPQLDQKINPNVPFSPHPPAVIKWLQFSRGQLKILGLIFLN